MNDYEISIKNQKLTVNYPEGPVTFQLVEEYPRGFSIWNIGSNMPKGYLPFCRLSRHQPFEGGRNIEVDTLKAMKVEGAEYVLAVIGHGSNTIKEMEDYLIQHQDAQPGTWPYVQSQRIRDALPVLKKIKAP